MLSTKLLTQPFVLRNRSMNAVMSLISPTLRFFFYVASLRRCVRPSFCSFAVLLGCGFGQSFFLTQRRNVKSKALIQQHSALILLCIFLWASNAHAGGQTSILILHSYSEEYPWTRRQHEGFLDALTADPAVLPIYEVEHLDTKRREYDDHYGNQFADYLRFKYSGYRPALIYVTDDDALVFALKFFNELFPGVPIFFSGINDYSVRDKLDPARQTGVFEKKDISTNLAVLLRMDPKLRSIILVGDGSSTYQAIEQEAHADLENSSSIKTIFIAEKRFDRVLEKLQAQPPGTYLFLTTVGGWTDVDGKNLLLSQIIPKIVELNRFVVLSMEDVYLFKGVLGGFVTSGWRQGQRAGQMALAYLHGTPMVQLPPLMESPNEYIFAEDVLERHRLKLPGEILSVSKMLNQKPSFYQRNRTLVVATLDGLALLLFFVVLWTLAVISRKNRTIRQSEMQFREAQRVGRVGSYVFNIMADYWKGSDVLYEILGIGRDYPRTLEGWLSLVHESQRSDIKAYLLGIVERHERFDKEYRLVNGGDGGQRWVLGMGEVEYDSEGKPARLFGTIQDITERKQVADALQQINDTLEQRVQQELAENREKDHLIIQQSRFAAMGEMIGNIAHQWRQPLNTLILTLANIEDAFHYNELTGEYLATQVADGKLLIQKMSSTIDDFRNFFRPHKQTKPFSVTGAIRESISLVSASFRSHTIDIGLEADEDAVIEGFPNEFSQVLINLLINAKEAILANQVTNGRVSVRLTVGGQSAIVSIADNGGGIPVGLLGKVFEPYFSTKEMGTGIGLYMSKMIIEKSMHGHLNVHNQNNGAVFTIQCPLSDNQSGRTYDNTIDRN